MIVEFKLCTNSKPELYSRVDMIQIKGDLVILNYVDGFQVEFLTRIAIKNVQWFRVVESEVKLCSMKSQNG